MFPVRMRRGENRSNILSCKNVGVYVSSYGTVNLFLSYRADVDVGVAHCEVNPNTRVMNSRGLWLTYALGVGLLHIVFLSIPFCSVPVAWTVTNIIHNLVRTPFYFQYGAL